MYKKIVLELLKQLDEKTKEYEARWEMYNSDGSYDGFISDVRELVDILLDQAAQIDEVEPVDVDPNEQPVI